MYVPAARERVLIQGSDEVHLVLWVDHERQCADLMPLTGHPPVMLAEEVPFAEIVPFRDGTAFDRR